MRYSALGSDLFVENRKKFTAQMKPNSIAVFNSNDIYPVSADSTLPFQQHRDIYYLSGLDQEESIVLLFPDAQDESFREVAFVKETSALIAIWEGHKLTKEETTKHSGIETVFWVSEFSSVFEKLMQQAQGLYINTNEHLRAKIETQTREDRFIDYAKNKYPNHIIAVSYTHLTLPTTPYV